MREELMLAVENAVEDSKLDGETKDGLITELCDLICERIDPAGLA
jgi:hypothetical protein